MAGFNPGHDEAERRRAGRVPRSSEQNLVISGANPRNHSYIRRLAAMKRRSGPCAESR